ncbi:MAG: Abi family protein [Propionibacteriaceae bacterium]|nr:Abi family protein [Propionibacteriaceae bacterium]
MTPPQSSQHSVTPAQEAALDLAISVDRMGTYLAAVNGDATRARRLYIWDRDLSSAVLADIAIVEVALRNAMHKALVAQWGPRWYEDTALRLDDRSLSQLRSAWNELPAGIKANRAGPAVPGQLVAHCTFGFWVNLLDAGDHAGAEPRRAKIDYEQLWRRGLSKAFPGGRAEAAATNERFTRRWTHGIAKSVNTLRNRAAHHEPLVNGFPLPGQQRRLSALEGHETYLRLARMLDRNLEGWLKANTRVPAILTAKP